LVSQKSNFLKRLTTVFALVTVAVVAMLIVFFRNNEKVRLTYRAADQTRELLSASHTFIAELRQVAAQSRGYVITGDILYRTATEKAISNCRLAYMKMKQLMPRDYVSAAAMPRIEQLMQQRIDFSRTIMDVYERTQREAALDMVASNTGRNLSDSIEKIVGGLNKKELATLSIARREYLESKSELERLFSVLILFVFAMITLVIILVARNQRARNRYEGELNTFMHFFNHSNDYSCILSAEGTFERVNFRFIKDSGYRQPDLMGKPLESFVHPDDAETIRANLRSRAADQNNVDFVSRFRRSDGSYIWLEWNAGWDAAGNRIYAIGRDITARRRAAQDLVDLNRELESFSYSVSHDLRAPLRAVNGYATILAEDYSGKLDADANAMIETIKRNAVRMGELIDGLLAFSRLGRKELVTTRLDMNALVDSAIEELNAANTMPVSWIRPGLPEALGDRLLIRQVWLNLLSNALKYSRHRQQIVIETGSYQSEEGIVYFVRDNGAGFDMTYYEKLFGVFQRLHSQEEFEGTGIGLAMIARIIARHHGRIWAESAPREGACFYFCLPRT
jgi:PAS domain S-box-containing protein